MGRRNQGPRLRYLEKRSCYYIVWTERGRSRERSTGTAIREEAEIIFAEWLGERQKKAGPQKPSEVHVTDVLADYAENAMKRAADGKVVSPERIAYAIVPLTTFFEGRFCDFVNEDSCRDYRHWRNRSAGTVRRELGALRAALNMAFNKNRMSRQISIELPDAPPPKERWLTRIEAANFLLAARQSEKAASHLTTFVLIGVYTGKRKEAILSLRWSQVDLQAGVIDWERPNAPRTKKRRGRNPINPKLLRHLKRMRRFGSDLGPVVAYGGKPVKDVKKSFATACDRAGLTDVTPHTLRHTCATWLMQSGVPTWEAAGFLGMSEETLVRVYGHHHPEHQMQAATAF